MWPMPHADHAMRMRPMRVSRGAPCRHSQSSGPDLSRSAARWLESTRRSLMSAEHEAAASSTVLSPSSRRPRRPRRCCCAYGSNPLRLARLPRRRRWLLYAATARRQTRRVELLLLLRIALALPLEGSRAIGGGPLPLRLCEHRLGRRQAEARGSAFAIFCTSHGSGGDWRWLLLQRRGRRHRSGLRCVFRSYESCARRLSSSIPRSATRTRRARCSRFGRSSSRRA